MFAPQLAIAVLLMSLLMSQFYGLLATDQEQDRTEVAAVHLAQVTQAVASRMFEMGSRFVSDTDYLGGAPPGPPGSLAWLKNPATCSLPGLPAVPNDERDQPVEQSFLPCDFTDTDLFGNGYTVRWDLRYPGTRTTLVVGDVPFVVEGERRDDIGGAIALKAARHSLAGFGESTLDEIVRYHFDPDTATLSAIIDRMAGFAADPHLRIDGGNPMDAGAGIVWGNGMAITPNGAAMALAAEGGIELLNNTSIAGELTVAGTGTLHNAVITGVQVAGVAPAHATHAVYDQRLNRSGDVVDKPTCPAGSVAQIFVAAASVPTGDGVVVTSSVGAHVSGDIKRFRTTADDLGAQWQVWAEVFMNDGWIPLAAAEGDLRSSIKCT